MNTLYKFLTRKESIQSFDTNIIKFVEAVYLYKIKTDFGGFGQIGFDFQNFLIYFSHMRVLMRNSYFLWIETEYGYSLHYKV